MAFVGLKVFLAQWAKLHRFTFTCVFFFLFSPHFSPFFFFVSFGFPLLYSFLLLLLLSAGFPFLVAASDLSAPKKCRARFGLDQQNNWCGPCRCVWCVLALAKARWRLSNCLLGLPPLLCATLLPSLPPPPPLPLPVPPGYRDLTASSSHALLVYLCAIWFLASCFGG